MEARGIAVSVAWGRIAIGAVSLLAPGFVGRAMTGRDGSGGGTRLFARMVGARDLALGLGVLVALERGAPVRGWLEASAVVDGIDAAAGLLARHHLSTAVFPGAVGLAAAGALLSAWLHGSSTWRSLRRQDSRGDRAGPAAQGGRLDRHQHDPGAAGRLDRELPAVGDHRVAGARQAAEAA